MDRIMDVFVNRRGWVAMLPAIVMVSGLFGIEVTEEMLATVGDKILAAVMSGLALWSLYRPRS